MLIEVVGRSELRSDAVSEYASRRVRFALDRFNRAIERVRLRFVDINGPRGGDDKECQMLITLDRGQKVVITDTSNDLYGAVDSVVERAKRKVATLFGKAKAGRRKRGAALV
jgi:ribosome-associated translation inhibitor RaiA